MSAALATSTPLSPLPAYRQPKRRGSELLLLVLGFGVGTLAYVQVDYAVLGHLDDNTLSVLGVVALLLLIAHSAIRWRTQVWLCRPRRALPSRWNSVIAVAKSRP